MIARQRKVLGRALLTLLALGLALALGEALLRAYERRSLALATRLNADPIDLAGLKLNDTTISRRKPAGEFRLLSFGDSFAYSIMTPPFSYAGQIGSRLTRALGRPVRVVNFGEAATTVRDYTAAHAFWARRIEHDAALFNVYLGNDVLDVAYGYTPPAWTPNHLYLTREYALAGGRKKSAVPRKFPLRILDYAYALYLTRFQMTQPPSAAADGRFNRAARHNLSPAAFLDVNRRQLANFDPAQRESLAPGYRAIAEFFHYVSSVRRRGTRTLVVLSPNQVQVDRSLRERLAAAYHLDFSLYDFTLPARTITTLRDTVDPAIELLDLTPYFVCAAERGEHLYYLTNTHWGPEGNALAGRLIAAHIERSWFGRTPTDQEDRDAECEEKRDRRAAPLSRSAIR
ncbi:MAG TPA: hypothetical protein VFE33_28315 [Thermoanaerobaculia bacterium]|nr:hypothetical protein [Thermoanaerobaculia bacterium]